MNRFLLLMHNDASESEDSDLWGSYLHGLQQSGRFDGGSAIGTGLSVNKTGGATPEVLDELVGYLIVRAVDLEEALRFTIGNPVFEAGGTVEIRELPRT